MEEIFDRWPEKYGQWFETSIGRLVEKYESNLILEMVKPVPGEKILDAGCGTGTFARCLLAANAKVIGLELSLPMLLKARESSASYPFLSIRGNMLSLPFPDNQFDKITSITAIEFIEDARAAVLEAFRVTRPGGSIVFATLNSLSPWAHRRKKAAKEGHPLFRHAIFRSPEEMRDLVPIESTVKTAIHFQRDDDPDTARKTEESCQLQELPTGAFLAAK